LGFLQVGWGEKENDGATNFVNHNSKSSFHSSWGKSLRDWGSTPLDEILY
jgi:hypothetical protein